jgi:hypothetical protein
MQISPNDVAGAVIGRILCDPRAQCNCETGHCNTDYMLFYIDKIYENTNDGQLYNFILTARSIKEFSKTKIVACRVPTVALGLLAIGFDAITSGLGVIDNFTKAIIIKDDEGRMPTRHYFPELLSCILISPKTKLYEDILSMEEVLTTEYPKMDIKLSCSCDGCVHESMTDFKTPSTLLQFVKRLTR